MDASDETYEDGDRGPGVAAIAAYTIAGLEAALVGPGGDGDDASTGGASESRRAWLLAHAAQLAEGLTRRRNARKRAEQDDEDEDEDDDRADRRAAAAARQEGRGPATSRRRRRSPRRWRRCPAAAVPHRGHRGADRLRRAREGARDGRRSTRPRRSVAAVAAAFSRALRAHLELDPDFFQPPLGGALVALLQDSSGLVRRAAGRDIARVLTVFEREDQPAVMRAKILDRLSLGAALPDEDDPGPSSSRADETDAPADAREAAGAEDDPPGGSDARGDGGEEDPSDEERGRASRARCDVRAALRGGGGGVGVGGGVRGGRRRC